MRLLFIIVFATTGLLGGCAATTSRPLPSGTAEARPTHNSMIRGVVRNEHGWELSEISVLAISNEGTGSRTGYSDHQGIYRIDDLAPGTYTLRVRRGSALVLEQTIRVSSGTYRNLHLRLPAMFGDRPDQRARPIVDRSLIRSSRIRGR